MNFRQFLMLAVVLLAAASQFSKLFTSSTHMVDQTVLLVTAHPDDESMFFGPTVRHVLAHQNDLHFLVLSNGDAEGLGAVRAEEMRVAVNEIGADAKNVEIIDDERLQDGSEWSPEVVAEYVGATIDRLAPKTVITFDIGGVSGHQNHIAVFNGTLAAADREGVSLLTLFSVPLWRKYLFSLDALVSRTMVLPQIDYTLIASGTDYSQTRNALVKGHKSQMKWFRQLWSFFSRYMVVNDLGEIDYGRVRQFELFKAQKSKGAAPRVASGPKGSNIQTAVEKPARTKSVAASDKPVTRRRPSPSTQDSIPASTPVEPAETERHRPVHNEL